MLSVKADDFIDTVLSHVNYSFDRKKIRLELENHLAEKIKFYQATVNTRDEAENAAIRDMGDAKEIGEALNKMHKPLLGWLIKNIKLFAIIVALIIYSILSFNVGANHARNQDIENDTSTYISNLYWQINSTVNLLSYVENWGDSVKTSDHSVNPFSQLLFSLNTMKMLSQTATSYIGYAEDLGSVSNMTNSFDIIYQGIGGGISYNNQLLCYDFLKDGMLSENEIKFLTRLKDDLAVIQKGLVNDETNTYNFDIPLAEFSKIVNPFINKYNVSNLTGIGLSN